VGHLIIDGRIAACAEIISANVAVIFGEEFMMVPVECLAVPMYCFAS
jgi:hypothetical protein